MTCADCREALSARWDDEERPGEGARVDAHLAGCAACRAFAEQAATVTRLARTELVTPVPDMVDLLGPALGSAAPRIRRLHWAGSLRVLLATIGIGQVGLATGDVLAAAQHDHGAGGPSGASLVHLAHESSAWNLALAVGFLGVAARPSRLRGVLSLVGAFVGVLAALSAVDLVGGRVAGSRLLSHALVVLGLIVLVTLARATVRPPSDAPDTLGSANPGDGPPEGRPATSGTDPDPGGHDPEPDLRPDLKPSAYHRAA